MLEKLLSGRPLIDAAAPARLVELHRLVAEAKRRRVPETCLTPLPVALAGFLAGSLSLAAGMWATSRRHP